MTVSSAPAFLAELRASVAEWCATVSSLSPASCSHGPVDAVSCAWYHGVWPFLREVDMVSSPTWHHDFYRTWLGGASKARALRGAQLRLLRELRAGRLQVETPLVTGVRRAARAMTVLHWTP